MSDEPQLGRRRVLRGGAVAAGAAAGAVIASATAQTASAADPSVLLGADNSGTKTTGLEITSGTGDPALKLINATGPSLRLAPMYPGPPSEMALGDIVNSSDGPYISVSDGASGTMTTLLATGNDLATITQPFPATPPQRLLDTRSADGLEFVVDASSANPFDSAGRLRDGQWLDVSVGSAAGDYTIGAAFLNVTVTGSLSAGFVTLCPSGLARPAASTINFAKGWTIANAAFIGTGVVGDQFAVRIYARATTHVVLDLTGHTENYVPGPAAPAAAAMKARRANAKLRPSARLARVNRPRQR